ncbi:MAG: PHP domain-containing protein [Syntrophomonadaceae bacterium]|nr:PHP domain-containing protein [Syntrophomonadaceae bacterium]
MIIDPHVHAYPTSDDSEMVLEQIVERALKIGLDAVCITDHDSLAIRERARDYSEQSGFPIFVGAEVFTYEGDILVFGLDKLPSRRVHADYLLDLVEENRGIAISAHPFRTNNRGMGDAARRHRLHGIEVFNGSTDIINNFKAAIMAEEMGLPFLGASDAHRVEALGKFSTWFPDGIRNERDLINAIKQGNVYPVRLTAKGFEKINRRIIESA